MTTSTIALEIRFEQLASSQGGRYVTKEPFFVSQLNEIAQTVAGYSSSPYLSKMPPIYVDYFNSSQLNAFAYEEPGQAFIGISRGLINILHNAITAVLCDESIFSYAGFSDASLTQAGFDQEFEALPRDVQVVCGKPINAARSIYALNLMRMALHFVLHHELAHIANGHTLLRSMLTGVGIVLESERGLEKQAMEMDADCAALSQRLNLLIPNCSMPGKSAVPRLAFSRPEKALFGWFLGIYLFFRLQVKLGPILEDIEDLSHPPPTFRQLFFLSTVGTILPKRLENPLCVEVAPLLRNFLESIELCGTWVALAEKAFANMHSEPVDTQALQVAISPEGQAYLPRLHEAWARLYPKLLPLARGSLTKPQPGFGAPPASTKSNNL